MENEISKSSEREPVSFTDVELRIIRMICDDKTTQKIANELNIHERKIRRLRSGILRKTGARGSIGILKYAISNNIYTDF